MNNTKGLQIIVSGFGGQGVLFFTRLLAGAAIKNGSSVLTSETHGMAQRGGNVISHLKMGKYTSPLIRPETADGMIAMKPESVPMHGYFVKPEGFILVNSEAFVEAQEKRIFFLDADSIAEKLQNPGGGNLILLGRLLYLSDKNQIPALPFSFSDIIHLTEKQMEGREKLKKNNIQALEAGYTHNRS